jgi:hypothetical protein
MISMYDANKIDLTLRVDPQSDPQRLTIRTEVTTADATVPPTAVVVVDVK